MKTSIHTEHSTVRTIWQRLRDTEPNCIKTSIRWHSERNMCNSHVIPLFRSLSLRATLASLSLRLWLSFARWLSMHVEIAHSTAIRCNKAQFPLLLFGCISIDCGGAHCLQFERDRNRVWTLGWHSVNSTSFRHFTENILHKQADHKSVKHFNTILQWKSALLVSWAMSEEKSMGNESSKGRQANQPHSLTHTESVYKIVTKNSTFPMIISWMKMIEMKFGQSKSMTVADFVHTSKILRVPCFESYRTGHEDPQNCARTLVLVIKNRIEEFFSIFSGDHPKNNLPHGLQICNPPPAYLCIRSEVKCDT